MGGREAGLAIVATGQPVVGFVIAKRGARKLANLRARPFVTVVFRSAWDWLIVEGHAELLGPDDALEGIDAGGGRRLAATRLHRSCRWASRRLSGVPPVISVRVSVVEIAHVRMGMRRLFVAMSV